MPNGDHRVMGVREMVYEGTTGGWEVTEPVPIPTAKPAIELVDGRLVQKMSPTLRHQALEHRWMMALADWDGRRGASYHEWRYQFQAPGHSFASLVPDVAYLSREALDELGAPYSEIPARAPEIAVEILSPRDSERTLAWKIGAYLAAGTRVIFVVDPPNRTVIAHSADGELRFGPGDTVTHPTMPGFAYAIDAMFEGLYLGKIPRRRRP
ncbi:MAG TPA: Uma2 family endonuclease [Candidatus Elarobacter sp.]|nr:Uma2 family endonuclease [Candidatus Elarobacter sp.]